MIRLVKKLFQIFSPFFNYLPTNKWIQIGITEPRQQNADTKQLLQSQSDAFG